MTQLAVNDRSMNKTLKKKLGEALAGSRPAVRELTHRQVAETLSSLLDIDLTELVTSAWRSCDELVEAAERTRREPGSRAVVDIAEQHFAAHRDATLDISLDGVPVSRLPLRLEIQLELRSLSAVVMAGSIAEIASGTGRVQATLVVDQIPVPVASTTFDLKVTVAVRPPIVISRPAPPTSAPPVPASRTLS